MTSTYSLVMRAYPTSYREEHGDELVFTANELSDGWSFRESRSLLTEGLRTRTRLATNGSPKEAWASGIAFSLGFGFLVEAMWSISWLFGVGVDRFLPDFPWNPLWIVAFSIVPIAMMISTRWTTALLIVAVTGGSLIQQLLTVESMSVIRDDAVFYVYNVLAWLFQAGLLVWLASRTDGPRAFSPRSGAAFALTAVGVALLFDVFAIWVLIPIAAVTLLLVGLALITIDPRPLVAVITLAFLVLPSLFLWRSMTEVAVISMAALAILGCLALLARFSTRRTLAA